MIYDLIIFRNAPGYGVLESAPNINQLFGKPTTVNLNKSHLHPGSNNHDLESADASTDSSSTLEPTDSTTLPPNIVSK